MVMQGGKPLLIIAEDVEGDVRAGLVVNKLRNMLKVAAVKAPGFGEVRRAILQDIAIMTGGTALSEDLGIKLEKMTLDMLGRARKVTIDKASTTIVGGAGKPEDIERRCAAIRQQLAETTSDYDREKLQERLAKLSGGVAVIRVGAPSEVEMKNRKSRVEDALAATRAAAEEGIVPGGGVVYLQAAAAIEKLKLDDEQRHGADIVARALESPIRQICQNAGLDGSVVVETVRRNKAKNYGYDALRGEYCDVLAQGIVDPAKVARAAVENAASTAAMILTTETLITEVPQHEHPAGEHHHH
jgi:chaperonin GroEL